jgi:hypothetical protein
VAHGGLDFDQVLAVAVEDAGLLVVLPGEALDGVDRLPDRADEKLRLLPARPAQNRDAEVAGRLADCVMPEAKR